MRMANILKNVHMNVCHKASHQIPQVYQEQLLQMHNDAWEKFTFEAGKGILIRNPFTLKVEIFCPSVDIDIAH